MLIEDSECVRPSEPIEPATNILDEGKFLRIRVELPGITEEKIRIDLENHLNLVTIVASHTTGIQYKKVITIPCKVRFSKRRFFNGVLELILEKISQDTT